MSVAPGNDADLLQIFLAECAEVLDEGERTLDFLARRPRSTAALRSLFRHYHTLRGAAATVGRADLAAHLERGESLLQALLDGVVSSQSAALLDTLRHYHASVRASIEACESGAEPADAALDLWAMLAAPRSGATAETAVESNPSADGETEWSWRLPAAEVEALSLRVAQTAAASGNLLARARDMGEPLRALAPELRQLARATARLRRQLWRLRSAEPPDRQLRRRDGMPEARGEEVVRVAAGHRGFCLPIASVERAVALSPADRDRLRAERVLSFGGRRLPLLFLSPLTANGSTNETAAIVLRRGRRLMALAVDRAVGREEIVVHHLFGLLEAHPFVAGAALAADGEVLLQLDVERLFALCTHEALLPVDEAAAAEPVDAAAGLGVLVVDDSQVVRQLASRFLAAGGYQIDTAVDGLDALDKLASGRFRAVVTDVEMPGLDGFELLRALRGDARWSHLPVIVCTTLADEAHRTRAFELGANAFLTKPFSREQLCEQLSRLLAADEASSGLDAADEPGADRRH